MNVKIKDGEIIIRVPLAKNPEPSKSSGKTLMLYSSGGFSKTDIKHKGEPVSVSLNVCIPNRK